VGDQVGSIEPGKRADIVILAASPLDDIRAVSGVLAVYQDGALVSRSPARPPDDFPGPHNGGRDAEY